MSSHDDDVGGGPCHIDRSPSGLVFRRSFAPMGRSGFSDFVLPISTFPPRGATHVVPRGYSFGCPPGRCPGLVKHYRGRCGRDAIRIEHQGRTRGFRFSFSFYRRGNASAITHHCQDHIILHGSTATVQASYQNLPSHTVSPRRSLRDLNAVAYSAWLGVSSIRSQLSALEAWGVDDDGGTDAPNYLRVTPRREHSAPTLCVDAILLSTCQLWGHWSDLLRRKLGDTEREPQIF